MSDGNDNAGGQELEKLTRRGRNGKAVVRRPEVEAEIIAAMSLEKTELRRRAAIIDTRNPEGLSSECLVYLVRDAYRRDDEALVYAIWGSLAQRISPRVESTLRTLGATRAEDGVTNVLTEVGLAVLNFNNDKGDFFQVSFSTTVKRRAIDEFRRQLPSAKRDQRLTTMSEPSNDDTAAGSDEDDEEASEDWVRDHNPSMDDLEERERHAEADARIAAALGTLSPLVRQAFILREKEGWPIESKDPTELTIAKALNRSPRHIRNYLKEAETRLREWREGVQ